MLVTTQQNVQRPFQLKPLNSNSEEMIYYWDTEGYVNFTKVIFRSINRKLVSGEVGKLSLSLVKIEQWGTLSSSSFFISLFFTAKITGYTRFLGEETSRNHQAYIERPRRHYNIIRNKGFEEVRLNWFSNYFNKDSSTLFLEIEKLDKFGTDAGRQFQVLGPW